MILPSENLQQSHYNAEANVQKLTKRLFEVFDYDADGTHDFIGSVTASIADLTTGGIRRLGLISKSRKSGGTLVVDSINVEYRPSFLDYVTGGTEINFLVAVDFTASNSSPQVSRAS